MLNARSLCNKIADLHECIDRLKPEFFFISETWFSNDITNAMIVPNDLYHVVRADRQGKCGGGVCALISKMFNIIPVPIDTANSLTMWKLWHLMLCVPQVNFALWSAIDLHIMILLLLNT